MLEGTLLGEPSSAYTPQLGSPRRTPTWNRWRPSTISFGATGAGVRCTVYAAEKRRIVEHTDDVRGYTDAKEYDAARLLAHREGQRGAGLI